MLRKNGWGKALLVACCMVFLSACGDKEENKEPEKTVSDKAADEIIDYIETPQQKARDANKMILDADQKRREALDQN